MRIWYENTFHNSRAYIVAKVGDRISRRRMRDFGRKLCPNDDCQCGNLEGPMAGNQAWLDDCVPGDAIVRGDAEL